MKFSREECMWWNIRDNQEENRQSSREKKGREI